MSTTQFARTISRLASFGPESEFLVDLANVELGAALTSLAESSGATLTNAADSKALDAAGCIIDIELLPAPLVPQRVKDLISRVVQGGIVVVIVGGCIENPQQAAQHWGVCFDLHKVHGEKIGETVILRSHRRLPIERSRRKELRQIAHGLQATVQIGREGLSTSLVAATQAALERHGIVKVRQTAMCKTPKDEISSDLAWATGGQIVSKVGGVTVLYRGDIAFDPPRKQKG